MKVIHSGDWHIGNFKGPEENGVNLRSEDTIRCLEELVRVTEEEKPELVLVAGDLFHQAEVWQGRSHKEVLQARSIILRLSEAAERVIVMRGTPNHDSEEAFDELKAHFEFVGNVDIVTTPKVIECADAYVACVPGFDRGIFRANHPGIAKDEENEIFTQELGKVILSLKAMCNIDKPAILMSHYTVPGCNTESGQTQLLATWDPQLTIEALTAANYDLVTLGHIHRPQLVAGTDNVYYCGSINATRFSDEGQERGFWMHEFSPDCYEDGWTSTFCVTPYRGFHTLILDDGDIADINYRNMDEVALDRWGETGIIAGKIVRVLYECTAENYKAFSPAVLQKALYEGGAFYVDSITPEKISISVDRTNMSDKTDPESNLRLYLEGKQVAEGIIERMIDKARPIIDKAVLRETTAAFSGAFVPLEIEVKNYRAYAEEKFDFKDIEFCTINGQNGAGKSSLFMDAIIDCIYEKPREGIVSGVVPWLRNEEGVRSGYIIFSFAIGDKVYRIQRTRTKSGTPTLNLSELVSGEWVDRSCEKTLATQAEINKLIGIDNMTFKSCALIMQDQYGYFLEANKNERMDILGKLLGLGIYAQMKDIASEIHADRKKSLEVKKGKMESLIKSTLDLGNPEGELIAAEKDLLLKEDEVNKQAEEKDKLSMVLATQKDAKERAEKLLAEAATLSSKKNDAEQNRHTEEGTIEICESLLAEEMKIAERVAAYRELETKERELAKEAVLYDQTIEIDSTSADIQSTETEMEGYKEQLKKQEEERRALEVSGNVEEVRKKAAEYAEKKLRLDKMYEKSQAFASLEEKKSKATLEYSTEMAMHIHKAAELESEKRALESSVELLADSNCIDLENAECRFLAEAKQAESRLAEFPNRMKRLLIEKDESEERLNKPIVEIETEQDALGFSKDALQVLKAECEDLQIYEDKWKRVQEQKAKMAAIQALIDNTQSNLAKAEERLFTLKLKVQRLTEEREKYRQSYFEHEQILKQLEELKYWLEKERQIPVTKERKANAEKRKDELSKLITELETEIKGKQEQVENELKAADGMELSRNKLEQIANIISVLAFEKDKLQVSIGGLRQKVTDIRRIHEEIKALQNDLNDLAEDMADYELLKQSFSLDGIPHQIIRSILPKIETTANSILGQMTGGQMGIEFRTEKELTNKKETVALDIYIEEYGKPPLPYLSRSGGEKVKASLAVIIALAEMKASSVGIQFGMLFIDEPPFLDSDGVMAYCDALETIRDRYPDIKIMAITHDPAMKARFPQNLDVVKTTQGSKVIY